MSVMDMTSAVLGMIPGLDQPVYLNQEPDESEMPPWVIATCTTDGHRSTEAARYTAHVGRLEIRVVDLTADAVNVICDDRIIPAMKYRVPAKTSGFTVGQLILDAHSGAYAAGLTADECLANVVERVKPYFESAIEPELRAGKTVLIAAHGNSLRAIVKMLDNLSEDEIAKVNIPTAIPLLYELDENFKPVKPRGEYLDPEAAAAGAAAVAAQGQK